MKIEITLDTTNIDRERIAETLYEWDAIPELTKDITNNELVIAYVRSVLGSNADFDNTGIKITEIKE